MRRGMEEKQGSDYAPDGRGEWSKGPRDLAIS